LVEWGICSIETAINLATIAPRQAIGQTSELRGRPVGDLVRWRVDGDRVTGWARLAPLN
jgi:N-acetylglucosamine-6-phosphate deacetylase